MLLSIVTVSYNSANTLKRCIESVLNQDFNDFEYLIVDGGSTDGSSEIIRSYSNQLKFLIEPDNGIYDAMNKGLLLAKGKYILYLNSDDRFFDQYVLSTLSNHLKENPDVLLCNIQYEKTNIFQRSIYKSSIFTPKMLEYGIMPPHPGSIIDRSLLLKNGMFNTNFKIAADFDLFCKLYSNSKNPKTIYLDEVITVMSYGGASTSGISSKMIINFESFKSLGNNGFKASFIKLFFIKYIIKIFCN